MRLTEKISPIKALGVVSAIATAGLWIGCILLVLNMLVGHGDVRVIGTLVLGAFLTMVASDEAESALQPGSLLDDAEQDEEAAL